MPPTYFYHLSLEIAPQLQPHHASSKSLTDARASENTLSAIAKIKDALSPFTDTATALDRNRSGTSHYKRRHYKKGKAEVSSSSLDLKEEVSDSAVESAAVGAIEIKPVSLSTDLRFDWIAIEGVDFGSSSGSVAARTQIRSEKGTSAEMGTKMTDLGLGLGLATKGRFVPFESSSSSSAAGDSVWGIVHLYRDGEESLGLSSSAAAGASAGGNASLGGASRTSLLDATSSSSYPSSSAAISKSSGKSNSRPIADEECTTLCILAVPSYMSPADFLGFVGEETREDVSHFRMIRTARANRYMVLMRFRDGKRARRWWGEWNGRVFNDMEPETCHVVFVKTVEIQESLTGTDDSAKFPNTNYDPFIHARDSDPSATLGGNAAAASLSTKPLAPPTPALIELPTCPVCLERMDETTGLLTIICQHVFHCTCLQKWSGSGCPVCRFTHEGYGPARLPEDAYADITNECTICHADLNLWLCLICGNVGCGRYDAAHAFAHFKDTRHSFAMDLATQRVWDYEGDGYVHRIIQNKADGGKLVELPAEDLSALDPPDPNNYVETNVGIRRTYASQFRPRTESSSQAAAAAGAGVPQSKLDNMSLEYTHLLTSQLESQRAYYEEILQRAATKASEASNAAASASTSLETLTKEFSTLKSEHMVLLKETIPGLERDLERMSKRASRFEEMSRTLEKEYRAEKALASTLSEKTASLQEKVNALETEKKDLEEQNRDLTFFISSREKLERIQDEELKEELKEGSVEVAEAREKKKKNRGRKAREKGGKGKAKVEDGLGGSNAGEGNAGEGKEERGKIEIVEEGDDGLYD